MACSELLGFNCRVANKPGVQKVHIFLFDQIGSYVYTADDLNFVTGYSALSVPTSYKPSPENSTYAGSKKEGDIDLFLHQLTLSFPKMEKEKRAEFGKLKNLELTIIFEDANGTSWIIGQHHPAKHRKADPMVHPEGLKAALPRAACNEGGVPRHLKPSQRYP